MNKGFTLIELIVTIAIISVLSGIILFTTTQYINKGKDSNIAGNLAALIPSGETFYNNNNYSYSGFCNPASSSVLKNAITQMPLQPSGVLCRGGSISNPGAWTGILNPAGVCCKEALDGQSWAACTREFANTSGFYCVDSRGMKKEITNAQCSSISTSSLSPVQCP